MEELNLEYIILPDKDKQKFEVETHKKIIRTKFSKQTNKRYVETNKFINNYLNLKKS